MAFEPVPESGVFRYGTPLRPMEEGQTFSAPRLQPQETAPQAQQPQTTPLTRPTSQPRPQTEPDLLSRATLEDVVRSQIGGTQRGLVGLLGLPGDIGQLTDVAGPLARYYGSRVMGTPEAEANRSYEEAMRVLRERQTPEEREGRRGRLLGINFPTSTAVIEGASFIPGITYEPQTRAGRIAHTVGEFMGSAPLAEIAAPLQIARGATTAGQTAARIGRAATTPATIVGGLGSGAAGEMTYGGENEGAARLVGGLAGTAAGAGAGSIAGRIARAASGSPEATALEAARRGLGQRGVSLDEAARLSEAGHDVRLTDIAGMEKPTAVALGRQQETRAAQDVLAGLSERARVSQENVANQINSIYGATIDPFVISRDAAQEASKVLKPQYRQVFNLPEAQAIWSPELQNLTNTSVGRNAISTAFDNLTLLEGTPYNMDRYFTRSASGDLTLRPDVRGVPLEVWDQVKKNLDAQVNNLFNSPVSRDAAAGAALKAQRDRMRAELDRVVEPYKDLRAEAQRYKLGENAFEAGQELIRTLSGKSPRTARELAEFRAALPDFTDIEKNFVGQGVASYIASQPNVAAKMFMANDSRMMNTLRAALGDEQFNKIRDVMVVHDLANSMNAIRPQLPRMQTWTGAPVGAFLYSLIQPGMTLGTAASAAVGYGAFRAKDYIQNRNAARLLELVNTNDPAVLRRLAEEASQNPETSRTLAALGATLRAVYATEGLEGGGQQQQPQRQAGGRVGRASGGRLMRNDHSARAATLIRAAEAAKKAHNATTEGILEQPDEAVAKALSIANKAI